MHLKDIALKNIVRRKAKAAFILAGLIIGVGTVVGIITFVDAMTADINHKLEKYGANILIVPRTDNLSLTYGGMTLGGVSFEMKAIKEAELKRIDTIKNARNVAAVGPMVLGSVDINGRQVLIAGVDFVASEILKPWWRVLGNLPESGQILIGSEAARILGLKTGDVLNIKGRQFMIAGGLAPTGSQDDQLVFMQLADAQAALGKAGEVSMVEVAALCNACPIHEMVRQIAEALPDAKVMAIQQVVKGRMETLGQFKQFSYFISAIIVIVGGLVVLVTLMGSVRERTEEIGIFRAIGFRKGHVMQIIFFEAGLLSVAAGILGYAGGLMGTRLAFRWIIDTHSTGIPINPLLAGVSIGLALTVGLLAAAYPAFMAARLDPSQALKTI